jgi:hypothetical protein
VVYLYLNTDGSSMLDTVLSQRREAISRRNFKKGKVVSGLN